MAIDNLNYMVSWLPAWQQTDKYSTNPWCIKSKNLDIFSSSKSVKATAWSEWVSIVNDYVDIDSKGNLRMMSDGKVYDSEWTLVVDPTTNYTSIPVSYTWEWWTYSQSTFGTPKKMFVKYVWDEWQCITVFTTTTQYTINKNYKIYDKTFEAGSDWEQDTTTPWDLWYRFYIPGVSMSQLSSSIFLKIKNTSSWNVKIRVNVSDLPIEWRWYTTNTLTVRYAGVDKWMYYDEQSWNMIMNSLKQVTYWTYDLEAWELPEYIEIPIVPYEEIYVWFYYYYRLSISWSMTVKTKIDIDVNGWYDENHRMTLSDWTKSLWDTNELYTYLVQKDRKFLEAWEYYFELWDIHQMVYNWDYIWVENQWAKQYWNYSLKWIWDTDPSMEITSWVIRNTNPYLIWNWNWSWYIIPAPIWWDTETPYKAEWVKFLNAVPIDYYMYLVGEERGVSGLYVYSWQQLVKLLSGTEIKSENDLVDNTEQFKFDWTMCNYRGRIVLGTEDWRVFMYGKTTNWNWWAFIHETWWDITDIKVENDKLVVYYTKNSVKYKTTFQDAIHSKNYNTEWEAEYPITIWNHILEKEEADLYASYILCKNNSLEFRASANHYQYWSFKGDADITIWDWREVKVWCWSWDYKLTFVEKNWLRYTFKLEGDLPVQTVGDKEIKKVDGTHLINYTEYNNFRRIWIVESDKFIEDKIRFHNINNLLDLPNSHSIQIMVRWKGTANHSPELFSVDLVANQRERW